MRLTSRTPPTHARLVPLRLLTLAMLALMSSVASAAGFDHSALDRVLRAAVRDGRVDYSVVARSADLPLYRAALARAEPSKLATDDRLAFWINAYNALVLSSVADHPRIARPLDVKGFFDARRHVVAGRSLTLNQIENDIIRKEFAEPLVHFGLVCAAVSCPPIAREAFTGSTVRARLAENARRYLASSANGIDASKRAIQLSQIFEWYLGDFGGERGLRAFLGRYAPASFSGLLAKGARIEYRPYDWSLNGRW